MSIKKYIIALSFVAFSFFSSIPLANASCSLQSLKECDRTGLISVLTELIKYKQLNNKADLAKFKATEIVSNNSESVEFWTQAYCPNSGTKHDYGYNPNYFMESCEKGVDGSHGGCKTCAISKINLVKDYSCNINSVDYYKLGNDKLSIKVDYFSINEKDRTSCNYCKVNIVGNGINQAIESYCDLSPSFSDDYNFDGFNDISIRIMTAQNNSSNYYLYNQSKNKFVFDEWMSGLSNITINKDKKQLLSRWDSGGNKGQDIYSFKSGKFILTESSVCDNCACKGGEGWCPARYKYDESGNSKLIIDENLNIDAVDSYGQTFLISATEKNNVQMIKDLLVAKASINIKNKDGKTALDIALEKGYSEIAKILDPNIGILYDFFQYLSEEKHDKAYGIYVDREEMGYDAFKEKYISSCGRAYIKKKSSNSFEIYFATNCSYESGDFLPVKIIASIRNGKVDILDLEYFSMHEFSIKINSARGE